MNLYIRVLGPSNMRDLIVYIVPFGRHRARRRYFWLLIGRRDFHVSAMMYADAVSGGDLAVLRSRWGIKKRIGSLTFRDFFNPFQPSV